MSEKTEQKIFLSACLSNKIDIVRLLLSDSRVDPSSNNNSAFYLASQNDHSEIVRVLLADSRVNPSSCSNYAIRWASYYGCLNVVRELLTDLRVNPSSCNNWSIKYASCNGHHDIVRLLLSDYRVLGNYIDDVTLQRIRPILEEHRNKQIAIMFFAKIIRGIWRYLGPEIAKHIKF